MPESPLDLPVTETVLLHDPRRRAWDDPDAERPIRGLLWHPTTDPDGPSPLVLVSHGDGAAARDMEWLAAPLAAAGFRVASVDHHGNNWVDGYLWQGFAQMWERPDDMRVLLAHVLASYETSWVAAAGFSAGGYTAAALLGARVDPDVIEAIVRGVVQVDDPREFPGLFASVRQGTSDDDLQTMLARAGEDFTEPRAQAGFLICPGASEILSPPSIEKMRAPVAVVTGSADDVTPEEDIRKRYVDRLPDATHRSVGPYGHADFFPSAAAAVEMRDDVARWAVQFLRSHLSRNQQDGSAGAFPG